MQILDCTLRDGGYYTDWYFSEELVDHYLKTISQLPISIIELGYLSYKDDSNGPFYHLNPNIIRDAKILLRKDQKIYVMINLKEINNFYNLKKLIYKNIKYLSGIRFAVSPFEIENYLTLIKKIKNEFDVLDIGINLMYLSKWYENKFFLNKILKQLKNYADSISLVDSYGAMLPEQVKSCLVNIEDKNINLGCHFHNNCGLALANTLAAVDGGCKIADTTIKGMGRGAGNANTELLIAIKKKIKTNITSFDINNLTEKFDHMKNTLKWGESYAYAFSAQNGFSQDTMMDLIQKKRLDVSIDVKAITISKIKSINFQNVKKLNIKRNKTPILIGGAPNLKNYGKFFFQKIGSDKTIILSGSNAFFNFISLKIKIKNPIILILSGSEIKKIELMKIKKNFLKSKIQFVVIEKDFLPKKFNLFKDSKVILSNSIALNPLLLTGLLLEKIKIKNFNIAFFDGETDSEKGRIVMEETERKLRELIKKKFVIKSYTKTFLSTSRINLWSND